MTLAPATRLWSRIRATGPGGFIFFAVSIGIIALLIIVPSPRDTKEAKRCDEAVSTLLTTADAVELQRAMFLIRRLNCSVGRRL